MAYSAVPNDSRYIPFTQQSYCCTPTSIQMVLYRNGIPLVPAEEIGFHLGLTLPPEDKGLFYDARISETPPSEAGFGTQIANPEFTIPAAFAKLGIPLSFNQTFASQLTDVDQLLTLLKAVEASDGDALLCLNSGALNGEFMPNSGHVVVFDRITNNQIRIVDPSSRQPKWRIISPPILHEAITRHGDKNSGGIWFFELQK